MPEPDPASPGPERNSPSQEPQRPRRRTFRCDRCGTEMYEQNCKVICPNCGSRFDCSDLTLYFD